MSGPYEENPGERLQPPPRGAGRPRAGEEAGHEFPFGDFEDNGVVIDMGFVSLPPMDFGSDDDDPDLTPADGRPWTRDELRSARSRAQARAKTRLSHEYRLRYRQLYAVEVEREGLSVERPHRVGNPSAKTVQREKDAGLDQRPPDGSGASHATARAENPPPRTGGDYTT